GDLIPLRRAERGGVGVQNRPRRDADGSGEDRPQLREHRLGGGIRVPGRDHAVGARGRHDRAPGGTDHDMGGVRAGLGGVHAVHSGVRGSGRQPSRPGSVEQWPIRVRWAGIPTRTSRRKDPRVSLRRTIAAVSLSAFALGGLAACGDDDEGRETAPAPTTSQEQAAVPTAEELTDLLNRASDPAVPVEEKLDLVEGGAESPELFDQIAALKAEQGADVSITGVAEGDIPGTLIANTVIVQPGQEDINVQAQFIQQDGQWQLQQSFACALVTNAGLEAPPSCAVA